MKLELIRGDLTKQEVDAIVNAANTSLLGGGGVDGAIHRAGGPAILEDCRKIVARQGGCKPGEAVLTTGGNLPARHVIHTVGPVYRDGESGEPETLASAYRNSLQLAHREGLRSVAFPSISTGVFGYPVEKAARVALATVREFLRQHPEISVRLVAFSEADLAIYQKVNAELEA